LAASRRRVWRLPCRDALAHCHNDLRMVNTVGARRGHAALTRPGSGAPSRQAE